MKKQSYTAPDIIVIHIRHDRLMDGLVVSGTTTPHVDDWDVPADPFGGDDPWQWGKPQDDDDGEEDDDAGIVKPGRIWNLPL